MQTGTPRRPLANPPPQPPSRFPLTARPPLLTNGDNFVINSPFNSPQSPQATTPDALNFYRVRPQPATANDAPQAYSSLNDPTTITSAKIPRPAPGQALRKTSSSSSIGPTSRSQNASFRDLVTKFDHVQETEDGGPHATSLRSPSGLSHGYGNPSGDVFAEDQATPPKSQQDENRSPGSNLPAQTGVVSVDQPRLLESQEENMSGTMSNGSDSVTSRWLRPGDTSSIPNLPNAQPRELESVTLRPTVYSRRRSEYDTSQLGIANSPQQVAGLGEQSPRSLHQRSVSDLSSMASDGRVRQSPIHSSKMMYDFPNGTGSQAASHRRGSSQTSPQSIHERSTRSAKWPKAELPGDMDSTRPSPRSLTPPARLLTTKHEPSSQTRPSSSGRVKAIITAPAMKSLPPLKSSRPRQHVSSARPSSPTLSSSSQHEDGPPAPFVSASNRAASTAEVPFPTPEKGNLLTQLSNAVYPRTAPKLSLDIQRIPQTRGDEPVTGTTEFEEDQAVLIDMPGAFPGTGSPLNEAQRTPASANSRRGNSDANSSLKQSQSGQLEAQNVDEAGTVLDKIMELRLRSSLLLSGVLGSLPSSTSPTSPSRNTFSPRQRRPGATPISGADSPLDSTSSSVFPTGGSTSSLALERTPSHQPGYLPPSSATSENGPAFPMRGMDEAGMIQIMYSDSTPVDRRSRTWQNRDRLQRSTTEESISTPIKSSTQAHGKEQATTPSASSPSTRGFNRTPSRATLDSDSYSVINRVLDQYYEIGTISTEMVQSFQQHIIETDPEFAARSDIDSMSIARAALEDLVRDHSQSNLFGTRSQPNLMASQSRTDVFAPPSNRGSPPPTPKNDAYTPTVRNVTSVALQNLSTPSTDLYAPEPMPINSESRQQRLASSTRPSYFSDVGATVSGAQAQGSTVQPESKVEDDVGPTPPPKDVKYPPSNNVEKLRQVERLPSFDRVPPRQPSLEKARVVEQKPSPDRIPPRQTSFERVRSVEQRPSFDRVPARVIEQRPSLDRIPPRQSSSTPIKRPVLPEIPMTGGLGLFNSPRPSYEFPIGGTPTVTSQPQDPSYSYGQSTQFAASSIPNTTNHHVTTPVSATTIGSTRTLSGQPAPEVLRSGQATPATSVTQPASVRSSNSALPAPPMNRESSSIGHDTSVSAEQRRLTKRRHLIKELVDTEFSFNQDMKVIEDIYKGTASAVEALTPDDRRILFGNSAQIVEFSETFLDTLKQAASSVYVMPRTNKWRIKRGSMTEPANAHEDGVSVASLEGTDDERDRKTYLGEAFGQHMSKMERVYGDYLRNHDLANQRLSKLQNVPQVNLWLNECHTYASDITSAWDLDSLLVKPVQRILKYPLLLKSLLEVTPNDHPDYDALSVAVKQMMDVSYRINESKKRAEILEQVVNRPAKRKDLDVGGALLKAFGRRNDKLKQQVGLSDAVEDPEYKAISEKFGGQFFQLQVVMKDMEMYKKTTENFIEHWKQYVEAIELMINEGGHHSNPEIEAKWRRLILTIREMIAIVYMDHESSVRRYCINPMADLLKIHEAPQKLMARRKKCIVEYATYLTKKNRGEKLDKKTQEQGEQFIALNETLKDELPKLFSLTAKLVQACLRNYVDIQVQWHATWQRKIRAMVKEQPLAKDMTDIVEAFHADFAYPEAQMQALNLCNIGRFTDASSMMSSAAATLVGTDETSYDKRPSNVTLTPSISSGPGAMSTGQSPTLPYQLDLMQRRSNASSAMIAASRMHSPRTSSDVNRRSQLSTNEYQAVAGATSPQRPQQRLRTVSSGSSGKFAINSTPPVPPQRISSQIQTVAYGPYSDRHNASASNRPVSGSSMRPPPLPATRNPAAIAAARLSASSAKSLTSALPTSPILGRASNSTLYSVPNSVGGIPIHSRQRGSAPTSPQMDNGQFSSGIFNSALPMSDGPSSPTTAAPGIRMSAGGMAGISRSVRPVEYNHNHGHSRNHSRNYSVGSIGSFGSLGGNGLASAISNHMSNGHDDIMVVDRDADTQARASRSGYTVLFLAASLFEFNIDRSRKEAGYPYLTYVPGEVFDVIGERGELWLAKNQDDPGNLIGWIWEKHFAKLMPDGSG